MILFEKTRQYLRLKKQMNVTKNFENWRTQREKEYHNGSISITS